MAIRAPSLPLTNIQSLLNNNNNNTQTNIRRKAGEREPIEPMQTRPEQRSEPQQLHNVARIRRP